MVTLQKIIPGVMNNSYWINLLHPSSALLCWAVVLEWLLLFLWPQLLSDGPSFGATACPIPAKSLPPVTLPGSGQVMLYTGLHESPRPSGVLLHWLLLCKCSLLLCPQSSFCTCHLFPARILMIQLDRKRTLVLLSYVEQKGSEVVFFVFNKGKKKVI